MQSVHSRKIYLAFLGASDYEETAYCLGNHVSTPTKFVQVAEIELLGPGRFHKLLLAMTKTAEKKHYKALRDDLLQLGINEERVVRISISEELEPRFQWKWFESILSYIGKGDHLVVDMTHGYRIVPIVFATAIHYLQQTRNIVLDAVYYGAYERNKKLAPIIDLKDFYRINQWAEAVGRLVSDADASKLVDISLNSPEGSNDCFSALCDPEFCQSLKTLVTAIKNVEIEQIPIKARDSMAHIEKMKHKIKSEAENELLDFVKEKYAGIAASEAFTKYSSEYFMRQLAIINLFLDHGLLMQGLTAMRELMVSWLDSLVLQELEEHFKGKWSNFSRKKRNKYIRDSRIKFSEKFFGALGRPKEEWDMRDRLDPDGKRRKSLLEPIYEELKNKGLVTKLQEIIKPLEDLRNGFDHAWTRNGKADDGVLEKSKELAYEIECFLRDSGAIRM